MADTTGQSSPPLINDLLSHGHEFSFPQVMRIVRLHLSANGQGELPGIPWQERLQVRPDLSLAFPAADVARVERTGADDADLLVTTTFLGLYGASSPLPTHYTEDLLDEASADSSVSRDFLDILHQRLYQLYFQCWSKYRLFVRVAEEQSPRDRERLFCLIGLGEQELRDNLPDPWQLVRYAGLLTQFPRSADGLQTLLRDALGIRRLEVEQCVLRRVPIPVDQQMRLGLSGMSLGVSTVLGSEIPDRMSKFRIQIGPLKKQDFDTLLPGTRQHERLAGLIRLYILDPLAFDLRITLAAGEAQPIRLGASDGPRLGWNSWCFAGDTLGEVSALFPIGVSAAQALAPAAADFAYAAERTEPTALIDYYQQELARLRDLAAGYAARHPELSAMMSGHLADPGVERLFEGVAFLNANLRQKLEDDFPEIIHDVIHAIQPNYLRPIPAATIITFSPKTNCTGSQTIPVGTELKSVPVDGTACTFTTRYPVEIHPLAITGASFAQPSGKPAAITLSLKLTGIALSNWKLKSLRLFLAGESSHAANLYLVLMRYVNKIIITPTQGGQTVTLDATHLKATGFDDSEALFPGSVPGAASLQLMHEYYIQPEKFMFLDLQGWEKWDERGEGTDFEIRFELDKLPFELDQVSNADFVLFATPAVNVFACKAKPISIEASTSRYPVLPLKEKPRHEIYSVENVTGVVRASTHDIHFQSSELLKRSDDQQVPVYYLTRVRSSMRQTFDTFISIKEPNKADYKPATLLSIDLLCTNGTLPNMLKTGDICLKSDSSPKFAGFSNCKPVTNPMSNFFGNNHLWRLLSLNALNPRGLTTKGLCAELKMIGHSLSRNYDLHSKLQKRIDGIAEYDIKPTDRLFGRSVLRGWEIRIKLDQDAFSSLGDMFLFGGVLNHFFSSFVSRLCFTRTIVEYTQSGKKFEWTVQMGRRFLG